VGTYGYFGMYQGSGGWQWGPYESLPWVDSGGVLMRSIESRRLFLWPFTAVGPDGFWWRSSGIPYGDCLRQLFVWVL